MQTFVTNLEQKSVTHPNKELYKQTDDLMARPYWHWPLLMPQDTALVGRSWNTQSFV